MSLKGLFTPVCTVCRNRSSNMLPRCLMDSLPIYFSHPQYPSYFFSGASYAFHCDEPRQCVMFNFSYSKSSKLFWMSTCHSCTQWSKWNPHFINKRWGMSSASGWHIIFQPFYTALLKHWTYWHKLIHFHQKFSVDTQGHCIFHHSDRQELK